MAPYIISQNVSKFEKLQQTNFHQTRLLAAAVQNLYFKDKCIFNAFV